MNNTPNQTAEPAPQPRETQPNGNTEGADPALAPLRPDFDPDQYALGYPRSEKRRGMITG